MSVYWDIQVLFCKTAFQTGVPLQVLVPGLVPPQVQDFSLALVELHEVPTDPLLQPVEVPLQTYHMRSNLNPLISH